MLRTKRSQGVRNFHMFINGMKISFLTVRDSALEGTQDRDRDRIRKGYRGKNKDTPNFKRSNLVR